MIRQTLDLFRPLYADMAFVTVTELNMFQVQCPIPIKCFVFRSYAVLASFGYDLFFLGKYSCCFNSLLSPFSL
jgi:hypothetical protein